MMRTEEPKRQFVPTLKTDYYGGEYNDSGVDLSLLHYTLSLRPLERLKLMEAHARSTQQLLEYGRKHREKQAAQSCRLDDSTSG